MDTARQPSSDVTRWTTPPWPHRRNPVSHDPGAVQPEPEPPPPDPARHPRRPTRSSWASAAAASGWSSTLTVGSFTGSGLPRAGLSFMRPQPFACEAASALHREKLDGRRLEEPRERARRGRASADVLARLRMRPVDVARRGAQLRGRPPGRALRPCRRRRLGRLGLPPREARLARRLRLRRRRGLRRAGASRRDLRRPLGQRHDRGCWRRCGGPSSSPGWR